MSHSILIFDEYEIIRKALEIIIKRKFPDSIIVVVESFDEVLEVAYTMFFDIAVIDINYNGKNEFSIIKKIKIFNPNIKVLIFSFFENERFKSRCFKNGASGIIIKSCKEESIGIAINLLLSGGRFYTENVKSKIIAREKIRSRKLVHEDIFTLSAREFEIANLLVFGTNNNDISKKLKIAKSTVSTYKKRILIKTNAENILQLAEIFKRINEIVDV